jgi:hypothetical protein
MPFWSRVAGVSGLARKPVPGSLCGSTPDRHNNNFIGWQYRARRAAGATTDFCKKHRRKPSKSGKGEGVGGEITLPGHPRSSNERVSSHAAHRKLNPAQLDGGCAQIRNPLLPFTGRELAETRSRRTQRGDRVQQRSGIGRDTGCQGAITRSRAGHRSAGHRRETVARGQGPARARRGSQAGFRAPL